jgi:RimJ/RimL family protein N-acetyltransferase
MAYDWGDALPTLAAGRVTLRHLTRADADDVFAIFSDPHVMRYWSSGPMGAIADAVAYIDGIHENLRRRTLFQWGVEHQETHLVIGTCTLLNVSLPHQRAEIGFAIARSFWGQGLARAAVTRLMAFAFEQLALHRLEADADPRNDRSLRLLDGLGFRREGLLRERYWINGERQDALMLGLLRAEWTDRTDVSAGPASRDAGA